MEFFKSKKKNIGGEEYDDTGYYDAYDNGDAAEMGFAGTEDNAEPERTAPKKTISFASQPSDAARVTMMLMKPSSYEEGRNIAEQLMHNRAVIMNLENANKETASNLIYFLTGVLYAISGHMKPVSGDTYMLTPNHMEIADESSEYEEGSAEQADPYAGFGGYGGYGG